MSWYVHSVNMPDNVRDAYIQQQLAYLNLFDAVKDLRKVNEQIKDFQGGPADPNDPAAKQLAQLGVSQREIKDRIRKAIDDRFGADQVIRQYRLEQLRKQIDMMEDEIRKAPDQRAQHVDEEAARYYAASTQPTVYGQPVTSNPASKAPAGK
jgi:predicted nuclease with TOPRIM domain